MIDIHCHLLPNIDDGASDMVEAIALAKLAVQNNIKHMILTPHINIGRFDNNTQVISESVDAFKLELEKQNVPLSISFGAEVRISADIMMMVEKGNVPFIGKWKGMDALLLEMPHSNIPVGSDKLVKWLMAKNIIPIIAHPERNRDVQKNIAVLKPFIQMGCLFQITGSSLLGAFGDICVTRAKELLEMGVIHFIASDAHNLKRRPPMLAEAVDVAKTVIGDVEANKLVYDNPAMLIELV